jgi:DNA-binding NarL/FixJ family response regulator
MDGFDTTVRPLKVLIADDHPLIVTAVRRALESGENIEVAGEAHSVPQVMSLIERRRPDIVLMDLRMPGVRGPEHIQQVTRSWPSVKVVVLSGSEDRASVAAAMQAGASAFLVKSVRPADIGPILRQVAAGMVVQPPHTQDQAARPATDLTRRERTVLAAAARGLTAAEIGRQTFVSEHTVKYHLTNIYRKLGVSNRAAAVRYALENGLTED